MSMSRVLQPMALVMTVRMMPKTMDKLRKKVQKIKRKKRKQRKHMKSKWKRIKRKQRKHTKRIRKRKHMNMKTTMKRTTRSKWKKHKKRKTKNRWKNIIMDKLKLKRRTQKSKWKKRLKPRKMKKKWKKRHKQKMRKQNKWKKSRWKKRHKLRKMKSRWKKHKRWSRMSRFKSRMREEPANSSNSLIAASVTNFYASSKTPTTMLWPVLLLVETRLTLMSQHGSKRLPTASRLAITSMASQFTLAQSAVIMKILLRSAHSWTKTVPFSPTLQRWTISSLLNSRPMRVSMSLGTQSTH
mmetsp:Transcript_31496/g.47452  ORF Transcript_31496/g.47452 Transcript_31496/m.47452 type:complete len:297 (-) Transcript_31496:566-1456(-)